MKTGFLKYLAVAALTALTACVSHEEEIGGGSGSGNGKATVKFHLDARDFSRPSTRGYPINDPSDDDDYDIYLTTTGEGEDKVYDLIVGVFEGTGPSALWKEVSIIAESPDGQPLTNFSLTTQLRPVDTECTLVIVANCLRNGFLPRDFLMEIDNYLASGEDIEEMADFYSLSNVETLLVSCPVWHLSDSRKTDQNNMLLDMAVVVEVDCIEDGMTIGTQEKPLRLERSAAKITVNAGDRFTINNVYMGGAAIGRAVRIYEDIPTFGSPFSVMSSERFDPIPFVVYPAYGGGWSPESAYRTRHYNYFPWDWKELSELDGYSFPEANLHNNESYPLYAFEVKSSPDPYKPFIVVKGRMDGEPTDSFYKLYFGDKGQAPLDVLRNHHYKFLLDVSGAGYASLEEAASDAMPPSNSLNWNVDVNDMSSHDVITNGTYYLGLSNSEVVIYEDAADGYSIAHNLTTLSTNAPWEMIQNATLSEPGLGDVPLLAAVDNPLPPAHGQPWTANIRFAIPDEIGYDNDVYLRIVLGPLQRDIKITQRPMIDWAETPTLIADNVYHAQITGHGEEETWLTGLTTISGDASAGQKSITRSTPGPLYICKTRNVSFGDIGDGGMDEVDEVFVRTGGEFYYSHTRDDQYGLGRVKVIASQMPFNLKDFTPVVYQSQIVGAFWRHDQTGERLFHFQVPPSIEMESWGALVVDGREWIKLDTEPSADPGVTWAEGEHPADMNDPANDARYTVTGSFRSVGGGSVPEMDFVDCRIGLEGAIGPDEVRYGRIVFYGVWHPTYAPDYTFTSFSYLYIRQGETADYVMRPEDAAGGVSFDGAQPGIPRPLAVPISPYNLTAKAFKGSGTTQASTYMGSQYDLDYEGDWTDYPSQSGAHFDWGHAYDPVIAYNPRYPKMDALYNGNGDNFFWYDLLSGSMAESCPDGYRRPMHGTEIVSQDAPTTYSELHQSLLLYAESDNNPYIHELWAKKGANSIYGSYADGFYDRRRPSDVNGDYYSGYYSYYTQVSGINSAVARRGRLFFNPDTHASLFLPAAGMHAVTSYDVWAEPQNGYYWTTGLNMPSGGNGSGWALVFGHTLGSDVGTPIGGTLHFGTFSRGYQMSIRCVKIPD